MRVLCAAMWFLTGYGSVDASLVHRHVGFKRFGVCAGMCGLTGLASVDATFVVRHVGFIRFGVC